MNISLRLRSFRTAIDQPAVALMLVTAASVLVYLNALANGFALDDVAIIRDNANVHSLSDLHSIWLKPYWPYFGIELGLWRPFAIFCYAVQWAAGGGSPLVFHAVSIVLHASVALLAFLLLMRLTSTIPALAGGLIFAVHPVHTESVANAVGQAELITAVAMMAACLVHAHRPPGAGVDWKRRIALIILFALALLTKENAVVLPGLLLIIDLAQRRIRLSWRGVRDYIDAMLMPMLLLACVLLAYLCVRFIVLEGTLTGIEAGPQLHFLRSEYRVLNALRAFPEILRLLVFPADLSADYAPAMILPVQSWTVMTIIGAVLLACTLALALLTPWNPAAGFAAAWFLVSIITVSNLLFPIGVLIAERTLYLPSFAVSAIIAFAWQAAAPRASATAQRLAPALLAVVVVTLGVRTWVRNPDWRSTETVLLSVLRDHPESYKAQWTQATWQWQLGHPEAARDHFEFATRIYDSDSQLLSEYANYLLSHGDPQRAVAMLERAFAMHPYVPRTIILLGTAYLQVGRYADALNMAYVAERNSISYAISKSIAAAAYDGLGRTDDAVATWRFVIRHSTLNPGAWAFLARNLASKGYPEDGLRAVRRGIDAAPGDTAAVRRLGQIADAIANRCYAPSGDNPEGRPAPRTCDPLGGREEPPLGLQNATDLHNATPVDTAAARPPPDSGT